MNSEFKYRRLIHYALILCTLLIQTVILIFFYNEYFNEKKLSVIENNLNEARILKNLTRDSREDLLLAGENLKRFLMDNNKEHLESYFKSLKDFTTNLNNIKLKGNDLPFWENRQDSLQNERERLQKLELIIDSVYLVSQKELPETSPIELKEFKTETTPKVETEVTFIEDESERKGFFGRIGDAFRGKPDERRDTVLIKTKYGTTLDNEEFQREVEKSLQEVHQHYQTEIKNYQERILELSSKNNKLYQIYDNLIISGNDLMGVYDNTIDQLNTHFENQFREQNSINNKIRKNTILGLLVLSFLVMLALMYLTRQSFLYEKKLKEANLLINNNLNFKNRILGMLSHEIRSPMQIINILLDRISKRTQDEELKENLKPIKFTNDSLLMQANQILEYAKNQEKPLELNYSEFDLKEEIDSILNAFRPFIESASNHFEIDNKVPPQTIVNSDKTKIYQLFYNIIGNANKFTENGTIKVIVETTEFNVGKQKLTVMVSDTGTGISEKDLKNIFKPYYQGIISEEVKNIGAGLGLNLCREIIQLFDGNISAKSTLGKGTKIEFEIILKIAE